MAQYGYNFIGDPSQAQDAASAITQKYNVSVEWPLSNTPGEVFFVDTNSASITQTDIDTVVQNAIGSYKVADWAILDAPDAGGGTGTGPGQPGGFLDFGKTINGLLAKYKKFVDNLLPKPTTCDIIKAGLGGFDLCKNIWWIVGALIAIVILIGFGSSFARGYGEGLASR